MTKSKGIGLVEALDKDRRFIGFCDNAINAVYEFAAEQEKRLEREYIPKLSWGEAFMELFDAEMPGYIDRILQALGYEKPSEKEEG